MDSNYIALPLNPEVSQVISDGVMRGHIKIAKVKNGQVYYELTEAGKKALERNKDVHGKRK